MKRQMLKSGHAKTLPFPPQQISECEKIIYLLKKTFWSLTSIARGMYLYQNAVLPGLLLLLLLIVLNKPDNLCSNSQLLPESCAIFFNF